PNARLLRDVHVQAIWEGTGNISALDVARAALHDAAGTLLIATLRERMQTIADPCVARAAALAVRALDGIGGVLNQLATLQAAERDLLTKRFTRQLAHAVTAALLVEDGAIQAEREGSYRCLLQAARYLRRYIYRPAAGMATELDRAPLDFF